MAEYRPLVEIPRARSETAANTAFDDGIGEIGIIAPVSYPFCGRCSRIRVTSDGKIRTCLFSVWDHDLHAQMRRGASDGEPGRLHSWRGSPWKEERHHIGEADFVPASRTMVISGIRQWRVASRRLEAAASFFGLKPTTEDDDHHTWPIPPSTLMSTPVM